MQRARISLEAAPRLLPSVFSTNETAAAENSRGEGDAEMHPENKPRSTAHPTRGAKLRQTRLRKARTKRAPLTTGSHLHLALTAAGFAFLRGNSRESTREHPPSAGN